MLKKLLIGLTIAIIMIVGVFSLVKTTYAQEITTTPENTDDVTLPVPQTLEYENMVQSGSLNGEVEAVQAQTRTRLFETQEGECDADCEPQQLREQIGITGEGIRQQDQLNQGEFDCTGDCVPQQLRLSNGGYGYAESPGPNSSTLGNCDGAGMVESQARGNRGNN